MTSTTPVPQTKPDPMPAAALAMWLFLAGEAMFFAGLMSAFIVLQSRPEQRALFERSAAVIGWAWPAVTIVLLASASAVLWLRRSRWVLAGLAVAVLGTQLLLARQLSTHQTVVTATTVYDGRVDLGRDQTVRIDGRSVPLAAGFDVHRAVPADLASGTAGSFTIPAQDVRVAVGYTPRRNNYFALFSLVTGAHAVHLLGGLAALWWLSTRPPSAVSDRAVALYWHFVNFVGIVAAVMLALG